MEQLVLHEREITSRVRELGRVIAQHYEGQPLLVVGLLKGSFMFLADLLREIKHPNLQVDFLALHSYRDNQSTGEVVVEYKPNFARRYDCASTHLLLVEDIIDSGQTMAHIHGAVLEGLGCRWASVEVCTLLKREGNNLNVRWVGFEVPKGAFVYGYGLDNDGRSRNLPFIAKL